MTCQISAGTVVYPLAVMVDSDIETNYVLAFVRQPMKPVLKTRWVIDARQRDTNPEAMRAKPRGCAVTIVYIPP